MPVSEKPWDLKENEEDEMKKKSKQVKKKNNIKNLGAAVESA